MRSATRPHAARWTAWASRVDARFRRHHAQVGTSLLFWIPGARVFATLVERWFRPTIHVAPHLSWSHADTHILQLTRTGAMKVQRAEASAPMTSGRVFVTAYRETPLPLTVATMRSDISVPVVAGRLREFHTRAERQVVSRHQSRVAHLAIERLVHRSDRIERIARFERALTLRREPAAPVHSAATISASASTPSVHPGRVAPVVAGASGQMPPFTVDLLADQVIRQIDRRVIARRERMGRV